MIELRNSAARRLLIATLLAASIMGCGTAPVPSARPVPDPDKIQLVTADRAMFDKVLAEHRGEVVFVDIWAHWCDQCVENFPHVVDLANRNWARGLRLVTVDLDSPEAAQKTIDFLAKLRAGAGTHLVSLYGGGSESVATFEVPSGALPCYKLYDRTGKLRYTFCDDQPEKKKFTLQDVDAAVELLLAE